MALADTFSPASVPALRSRLGENNDNKTRQDVSLEFLSPELLQTLDPLLVIELALLGIGAGFLAGLLGIGGGMVLVPFISYFLAARGVGPELGVKMAIATSMATIMFTSLSSVRAHHKRGAVRWDLVLTLAPGIVAGALLASAGVFSLLKGTWLSARGLADSSSLNRIALTDRQLQVLSMICEGKSNREIADSLGISEITAKSHVGGIFRELHVASRTQAVLVAQRLGLFKNSN